MWGLYSCVMAHIWSEDVLEVAFLSAICVLGHDLGDGHFDYLSCLAAPSSALFEAQSCCVAQTDLELCFTSAF